MRVISWITTLILAGIATSFAVSNPDQISLALWPTPFEIILPLYFLVFGPLMTGFFLGGFVSWRAAGKTRQRLREAERRILSLQKEADQSAHSIDSLQDKVLGLEENIRLLRDKASYSNPHPSLPSVLQSADSTKVLPV